MERARERERVKCIFYGIPGVEFNMFLSLSSSSFFPSLHPPLSIIDEFCGRCSERGIHLHTNIMLNNSRMAEGGRQAGREAEGEGRPNRYSISDAGMPTVPHSHDMPGHGPGRPAGRMSPLTNDDNGPPAPVCLPAGRSAG